ncbi:hypothetical protein [Psychromonas ossibalaenae]|uniref:hypothetical protein n=1 Tax=Psychromonas ossibalaenae TaxID=444922 RepID=UPI00037DC27C|nr:hypothetical protein [Psychromonas ossibalaenae]
MRYFIIIAFLLLSVCGGTASQIEQKSPHPGLSISNIQVSYAPQGCITPAVSGQLGNINYALADGALNDVVRINPQTQSLTILNAGTTQLIVTDSGNDLYKPARSTLTVTVSKAQPQPLTSSDLAYAYAEGIIHQVKISGAKGQLNYALSPGYADDVVKIGSAGSLLIWQTGETQITVKDDGGRNFLPAETQFKITINQAESEPALYTDISHKAWWYGRG